jgi:hypothetical protein
LAHLKEGRKRRETVETPSLSQIAGQSKIYTKRGRREKKTGFKWLHKT